MDYEVKEAGVRLDRFLSEHAAGLTRSYCAKLIAEGAVRVNEKEVRKAGYRLEPGDRVAVTVPEPVELELVPDPIPLDIRYEDDDLLVVNKPRGMVVHPSGDQLRGTLVNALLARKESLSSIGGVIRPGIVHRLDKDTSGLLLVAKTDAAHGSLSKQLEEKTGKRLYVAIANGIVPESGRIETKIGRDPKHRVRMAVLPEGRQAITHYRRLEHYRKHSLVELILGTGRTHQIRVHMAHLGFPLVGDPVYGRRDEPISSEGQVLHAKTIGFHHPRSGVWIEIDSEYPDYFVAVWEKVKQL